MELYWYLVYVGAILAGIAFVGLTCLSVGYLIGHLSECDHKWQPFGDWERCDNCGEFKAFWTKTQKGQEFPA